MSEVSPPTSSNLEGIYKPQASKMLERSNVGRNGGVDVSSSELRKLY